PGAARGELRRGTRTHVTNEQFLASLEFEFLGPGIPRGEARRYPVPRRLRPRARLLELPHAPVDAFNTRLPETSTTRRAGLTELCSMPRMSTFAIAALSDHAVREMPEDHAFL